MGRGRKKTAQCSFPRILAFRDKDLRNVWKNKLTAFFWQTFSSLPWNGPFFKLSLVLDWIKLEQRKWTEQCWNCRHLRLFHCSRWFPSLSTSPSASFSSKDYESNNNNGFTSRKDSARVCSIDYHRLINTATGNEASRVWVVCCAAPLKLYGVCSHSLQLLCGLSIILVLSASSFLHSYCTSDSLCKFIYTGCVSRDTQKS